MGATKRLGEMILEVFCQTENSTKFNAVRFGNVIQSNGSVMEIFRRQIAAGEPLTVTHRDVTRYFMTLDEASQLILQSAFVGDGGEIYVLDMGEPVKIHDLALSLASAVGHEAGVTISGLRPGEKMYEELSYQPDKVGRTANGKIFVTHDSTVRDTEKLLVSVRELLATATESSSTRAGCIQALREFGFDVG
jgi:FlaA1/EpsC-like NDP-sugar epimerase